MHIAIDALYQAHGGSLTSLKSMLHEWQRMNVYKQHRVTVFCSEHTEREIGSKIEGRHFSIRSVEGASSGYLGRLWSEQVLLPRLLRNYQVDVLFCPANTMPIRAECPTVVTFQNAAPFCPTVTPQAVGLSTWLRFRVLRRFILLSAEKAKEIIYISRYFQQLLNKKLRLHEEEGVVIYRAHSNVAAGSVDGAYVLDEHRIRKPFVLCVSHLYPYKNILELARAHIAATENGHVDVQLVVAGGGLLSSYETKVRRYLQQRSVDRTRVNLIGAIRPDYVGELLQSATLFAFPSTCENCPTSLIEALAAGLPIICSNIGVMPEIAGKAAIYFDPFDVGQMERSLSKVLADDALRTEMSRRSLMRAQDFPSAREVAVETLSVIQGVASV